jgi:dihydrofolate reductase
MGTVIVDLSMSLDGFVAGAGDGPSSPLGRGGEALFAWMAAGDPIPGVDARLAPPEASRPVVDEWIAEAGAGLAGRRTFDIAGGWAEGHPIDMPVFVVTHEAPTAGRWSPQVTFVTEGVEHALDLAQQAAGDKVVSIAGASLAKQLLALGKLDEIQVSIAPVLLGGGVRLFDLLDQPILLEQTRVVPSDGVTHLRYRVVRD